MQRGELWGEGTWGEASVGSNQAYGIRISNSRTAINQKFMQEVGNPSPWVPQNLRQEAGSSQNGRGVLPAWHWGRGCVCVWGRVGGGGFKA